MTECREACIVVKAISLEPPVTYPYSHEGSKDPPDIDEHIEDLEARITYFGVDRVVVHLTDKCLEVPLEETITEGDNR